MTHALSNVIKSHATARVIIQPEGVLSGWLPVLSQWVGNGWGIACPPSPGDQVLLVPQDGDIEQGVIVGRVFSVNQMPPVAPGGEFWLVHKTGSSLKLCNDGTIQIQGDLHVAGDVYDQHGALSSLRTHYNSHTHMVGSQMTSSPTPLD